MHLLTTRPPHLILVPVSALGTTTKDIDQLAQGQSKGEPSLLVRCLRDAWGRNSVVGVARKYWSEQAGTPDNQIINQFFDDYFVQDSSTFNN
jgi:hypothetical protein